MLTLPLVPGCTDEGDLDSRRPSSGGVATVEAPLLSTTTLYATKDAKIIESSAFDDTNLIALDENAVLCRECEAMWLDELEVGPSGWVDYGTYMWAAGRSSPDDPGEVEPLGPFEGPGQDRR